MSTPNEAQYDVNQEGPFWRVRPRHIEASNAQPSGLLEKGGQDSGVVSRSSRNANAQPHSDEEIKRLIRTGQSFTKAAADQYSRKHMGKGYAPIPNTPSSLVKQGPIGRVFALAATDHPEYKQRVFEAYKRRMPKVVADAKDYDDLLARSYAQLGKETKQQFDSLPVNMSFHRNGEGNYNSSKQMLSDVFNNRHLYVFQGGDPHDFLHEVDPKTGLNTNEMFRAIHDFYGHTVHGNQFGPKGEEEAWAAHGGMFSPLARLAMSSETRGQNSFVNYTPINAKLKAEVAKQEEAAYHARRAGNYEAEAGFLQNKRDLLSHFQYAPQKSVLLPPEMVSEKFEGGMPGYLKDLIQPEHGVQAELTHFSHNPSLSMTEPRMYGTGIKGAEASRLDDPTAVKHRTYFYEGKPERGEPGLGVHRYGATVPNLYPAEADPEHLRVLAEETNRIPMTAMANAGMTSGSQAYTDMERLAKEYGYKGVLSRGVSMPTAAVFEPTKVQKMDKGGAVGITAVKKRKDDRIPELELAAKALLAGVISRAEYDKTVKQLKPVTKYASVPRPATDEEALGALHENKRQHWRGADEFPEGHPVGLRLDIPAYTDHGVWVNSIHDESGAKTPVKYGPVSAVRNAEFDPGPSKAQRVATGENKKSPFARIKGEWNPMTDDEAVAHMQKHLSHPDYVQVGYDPRRRDYFYHRGDTRKPITHAEHVVQIGPLVLAKNPVYGKRKDFGLKDGGVAHMDKGGLAHMDKGGQYPYAQAHEQARINAIKMLGLHEHNTAQDRAKAMGFDTDAYHVSDADILAFDNAKLGTNTSHLTGGDPKAIKSAMRGHWFSDRDLTNKNPRGFMFGDVVYPVKLSSHKKINDKEFGSQSYIVKDPKNIKSRFAAFDPARQHENDLLAKRGGVVHMADGGEVDQEDPLSNLPPISPQQTTAMDKYRLALWAEKNNPDMLTANNNELAALLMRNRNGQTYDDRSEEGATWRKSQANPSVSPSDLQNMPGEDTFGQRREIPRPESFDYPRLEKGNDYRRPEQEARKKRDEIARKAMELGFPFTGTYYAHGGRVTHAHHLDIEERPL